MIKQLAGGATALIDRRCQFDKAVFILGHMRCGSTALSHILCSHEQISGYGEAHIRYKDRSALGLLILNQIKRNGHLSSSKYLFDKILHSRYDSDVSDHFFNSYAIFIIREPINTIKSIGKLFKLIGSNEYSNDVFIANYYEERLSTLIRNWEKFPFSQKIGISFQQLTSDTDNMLDQISNMIGLEPALTNKYEQPKNKLGHGAGDPLTSHKYNKIISDNISTTSTDVAHNINLPESRITELDSLYQHALSVVTQM